MAGKSTLQSYAHCCPLNQWGCCIGDNTVVWSLPPQTKCVREKWVTGPLSERVHVIEPVNYLEMVQFEKYVALIATDSGGVQKEAFFYQVPLRHPAR